MYSIIISIFVSVDLLLISSSIYASHINIYRSIYLSPYLYIA